MQETWVQSLGGEDALEEGMATHSSILAWRIPMDRGAWWATDWVTKHKHIIPRSSVTALTIYRYKKRESLIILKLESSWKAQILLKSILLLDKLKKNNFPSSVQCHKPHCLHWLCVLKEYAFIIIWGKQNTHLIKSISEILFDAEDIYWKPDSRKWKV